MKRLFTFGCSFTAYSWPTWADILGLNFDFHENWARSGGGNQFIFHSLLECWNKRNITKDDTVIIMWTNVYRNDSYRDNQWVTPGNQFIVAPNSMCNDERGYLIRDLATISATQLLLDSHDIDHAFLSMVPIDNVDQYQIKHTNPCNQDVLDFYQHSIAKIAPSVYETVFGFNWRSRPLLPKDVLFNPKTPRFDLHPSPKEHLEYLDLVLPRFVVPNHVRSWVDQAQDIVLQPCHGKNPWSAEYAECLSWPENFWNPHLAQRL